MIILIILLKRSRQPSAVWKYFEKEDNNLARCNICNGVYKRSGNTTNLSQHLNVSHPLLCPDVKKLKRKVDVISASSDDSVDDSPQGKRVKPQVKMYMYMNNK